MFHGRAPYNVLDLKLCILPHTIPTPKAQIAEDIPKQTEMIFPDVRNTIQADIKYKA